jgi:tRNA uridine 5-carbamoylmethylation protein Kti12
MEKKNKILIIVRGIPGSGKSTFAKEIVKMFPDNSIHWESDMFYMHNGVYCWKPTIAHLGHRWCENKVKQSFNDKDIVIVSNTFTTSSEMKPYVDFAHENGITVQYVRMANEFENEHGVPESTLEKMKARFVDVPSEIVVTAENKDTMLRAVKIAATIATMED